MAVYGYCRVSTSTQRIERQESNIKEKYPEAVIFKKAFTRTKLQGSFMKLASDAGAVYKINKISLVNVKIFEEYLETFRVEN